MSEKSIGYQNEAWQSFNSAFNSPTPDADRAAGRALYRQAIHSEIEVLDRKTDAQNRLIDMKMGEEVKLPKPVREPLPNIDMYG